MKSKKKFHFKPGEIIADTYRVVSLLGKGWEAEVYLVKEMHLNIERALKIFYPQKNKKNQVATYHAKKLHKLRSCSMLIQYHAHGVYKKGDIEANYLVSEYIEGELLSAFIKRQKGGRLHPFQALHLFYTLVCGLEEIHSMDEYHGDLHTDNIIISRHGLDFDIKIVDFFHWKEVSKSTNIKDDIVAAIHILYEMIGGQDKYASQPNVIKGIIMGKKKNRILEKFRSARKLREYIERAEWD